MMKIKAVLAAGLLVGFATPALADHHEEAKPEVVETNAKGQATKVKIGDQVYAVCVGAVQDSCINPREAGLKFGNRELSYWPGRPASEIDGPLPAAAPAVDRGEHPVEGKVEAIPQAN